MQTCIPEGSQEEEVVVVVSMVVTVDTFGDAEPGVKPVVSAWPNSFPFTYSLSPRILMSDFGVLA